MTVVLTLYKLLNINFTNNEKYGTEKKKPSMEESTPNIYAEISNENYHLLFEMLCNSGNLNNPEYQYISEVDVFSLTWRWQEAWVVTSPPPPGGGVG